MPGATPKRPNSGLTARAAVVAEAHPCDVVAQGLGLPAGNGGLDHGEVGLATSRGERGGDVLDLALRARELEDEHVLGQLDRGRSTRRCAA